MLTDRRLLQSRHEFRFGSREVILGGVAIVVIWALTFVLGILVGRELGSSPSPSGKGGGQAAAAVAPPAGTAKKPERAPTEDRLTFYQTLTSPTPDLPPPSPPHVEERLVPRETPAEARPGGGAVPDKRLTTPPARPAQRAKKEPAPGPVPAAPAAAAVPAPAVGDGRPWTVQVSSFRSRALADELLARLAAKGFEAYLVSVTTEEGRVRHRVRVGEYASRADAERVAAELRGERNLSPFVTTRGH